jgi:hypothetical protein
MTEQAERMDEKKVVVEKKRGSLITAFPPITAIIVRNHRISADNRNHCSQINVTLTSKLHPTYKNHRRGNRR